MSARPVPPPCPACGWQYDQATLDACTRGEVLLDPLPTHFCRPERSRQEPEETPHGND